VVAVIAGLSVPLALLTLAVWVRGKKDPAWKAAFGWAAARQAAKERKRDRRTGL